MNYASVYRDHKEIDNTDASSTYCVLRVGKFYEYAAV